LDCQIGESSPEEVDDDDDDDDDDGLNACFGCPQTWKPT
jgi:hypothetical protein